MQKQSGVNHSMSKKAQARRVKVIERLQRQLSSGKKVHSDAELGTQIVDLTDHDRSRIAREINVLHERV